MDALTDEKTSMQQKHQEELRKYKCRTVTLEYEKKCLKQTLEKKVCLLI